MRDGDKGRANQPTERAGQITEHTQPKTACKRERHKETTRQAENSERAEVSENQQNRMGAGKVPASRGHLTPLSEMCSARNKKS